LRLGFLVTPVKSLSIGLDALQGEAVALLVSRLAVSSTFGSFSLEGDALLVLVAINNPALFFSWNFASFVSYQFRTFLLSKIECFENV
jgi:hypothetical protein